MPTIPGRLIAALTLIVLPVLVLTACGASSASAPGAKQALDLGLELCALDLSGSPQLKAAATRYAQTPLEYATRICRDAKLVEPYLELIGVGRQQTGFTSTSIGQARQRAIERGEAFGVL